jgi:hypothetical protein
MDLIEFVNVVPHFGGLSEPDKIIHLAWYLHTERRRERFDVEAVRQCFRDLHMEEPRNLTRDVSRLAERKALLRDGAGYRLHYDHRKTLDGKYGGQPAAIMVSQLLKDLPGSISNQAERLFLSEALHCYRVQAFRATIVMTWNLAYDHVLRWVLRDPQRLAAFNSRIVGRIGPKRGNGLIIVTREDFEELKETEIIDICGTAGLFTSDNIKKVLEVQLTKRNMAAHPSLVVIGEPQANDAIYDLVTNIVLKLT